ncbi:MAG: D-alanyl-D-alanine carboxypeptidase/D-alanyl-D-alanine-endopeptidase [Acidobacteriota bacterium]
MQLLPASFRSSALRLLLPLLLALALSPVGVTTSVVAESSAAASSAAVSSVAVSSAAVSSATSPAFRAEVNRQVAAARRVAPDLGVHIVDLSTTRTVYGFQADVPRILASNTKLLSSGAALELLGPAHSFETRIAVRGQVVEGRLDGDLAVVGGGDPNLSGRFHYGDIYAVFRRWGEELRGQGIDRIGGDLYLINGQFQGDQIHPDWPRDQLTRWYEAPVDALSFNDNCVLVRVKPGRRPGDPVRVEVEPPLPIFEVESTGRTRGRGRGVIQIDRKWGTNTLTVAGTLKVGASPVEKWVAVDDPVQYFGAALKAALGEVGVRLEGKVFRAPQLPSASWRLVTVHRSDLLTTLEVVNKKSQNFYAESVLKHLGFHHCGEGTWAGGLKAVEEVLTRAGIEPGTYQLADGSGMSRGNRLSPYQMTAFLLYMDRHAYREAFLETLPESGEADTSWRRRLAQSPYRGSVWSKTGTLNGVSTLSGYVRGKSGRVYAFSLLMNGSRAAWRSRRAQDNILRAIIDHG